MFKNFKRMNKRSSQQKEKFKRYQKFVEKDPNQKIEAANYLLKVIVECLNYTKAIQALEYDNQVQDNASMLTIYREIESWIFEEDVTIEFNDQEAKEIGINDLPILLNPWNGNRVIDNLFKINDGNIFDGKKYAWNVRNTYLYPMNIIICQGANHSQLSARYKNKGKTIIGSIHNFRSVYSKVYFDGESYKDKATNSVIPIEGDRSILFYSGVIFELGRYLLESGYQDNNILGKV